MLAKLVRMMAVCALLLGVSACVTVEPPKPVIVNGAAGYLERIALPPGSVINISIVDLNTRGSIFAQKTFEVARVPVPFKFILPAETIDKSINYGVVAMITYKDQVLFQTFTRYPVINNGKFTTEVLMKPVSQ
ncbi:YbaY family lipoprotein [Shewanella submarina]|uniref:YbaY family lipoprotein n=1 Tax=Shewanella submarina TaxID=2016376 RepID=A0ABV7GGQ6_9GAMM|nr:YbaY family lipoprotein [Shewanella submarina]MCL1037806.1 YbaY family lipoprotein [Shewanella submarina]